MSPQESLRRPVEPLPVNRSGRDLPHSLQAEQAVLGAILIEETAFDLVAPILKAEDFYLLAHQHVFTVCLELAAETKALDPVLVMQRLDAKGLLGGAVPHEMPLSLSSGLGTAANVTHYAHAVSDYARLRIESSMDVPARPRISRRLPPSGWKAFICSTSWRPSPPVFSKAIRLHCWPP